MYDRWLISVAVYAPGQFPELLSLQCFDMESMILFVSCVASLVLYVSHAIPDAVQILAWMLLLCIISNARRRSFRLQVLLVSCGSLLGPALSGLICLAWCPALCTSLALSFWLLRSVTFLLASKIEDISTRLAHVPGTRISTRCVSGRTSETKRLERKAEKKAAKHGEPESKCVSQINIPELQLAKPSFK